jgi:hypothetical protein
MSDDMSEYWRDVKQASQVKRASNREQSAQMLIKAGVVFEEKNHGAHLIVQGKTCFVDFWPGTGRWNSRDGTKGFGIHALLEYVK